MKREHKKEEDSEMLVVHKPPEPEKAPEDDPGKAREAAKELARLRAMVAAGKDPAEREALIATIQESFGNEAASETIDSVRVGTEEEA